MSSFAGRDLLGLREMEKEDIMEILATAEELRPIAKKRENTNILRDKSMASLFYQPSTRTKLSFDGAMYRMGGNVLGFADPAQTRASKESFYDESLKDVSSVVQYYADIIVIRHTEKGAAAACAKYAEIPVINGGDGTGEHPTQGLLDLYTIQRELGQIENTHVVLVGDMTTRVMHSLPYGLARFEGVKVTAVSPPDQYFQEEVLQNFSELRLDLQKADDIREVIDKADVIYVLGTKHGRGMSLSERERTDVSPPSYTIDRNVLKNAQEHAIVLHPLPRTDELPLEVDETKFARYFEQACNGLVIRMALLGLYLGKI